MYCVSGKKSNVAIILLFNFYPQKHDDSLLNRKDRFLESNGHATSLLGPLCRTITETLGTQSRNQSRRAFWSAGAHPLTKNPEDSGYEIAGNEDDGHIEHLLPPANDDTADYILFDSRSILK